MLHCVVTQVCLPLCVCYQNTCFSVVLRSSLHAVQCTSSRQHQLTETYKRTHRQTQHTSLLKCCHNLDLNWIEEQTIRKRSTIMMLVNAVGPVDILNSKIAKPVVKRPILPSQMPMNVYSDQKYFQQKSMIEDVMLQMDNLEC